MYGTYLAASHWCMWQTSPYLVCNMPLSLWRKDVAISCNSTNHPKLAQIPRYWLPTNSWSPSHIVCHHHWGGFGVLCMCGWWQAVKGQHSECVCVCVRTYIRTCIMCVCVCIHTCIVCVCVCIHRCIMCVCVCVCCMLVLTGLKDMCMHGWGWI